MNITRVLRMHLNRLNCSIIICKCSAVYQMRMYKATLNIQLLHRVLMGELNSVLITHILIQETTILLVKSLRITMQYANVSPRNLETASRLWINCLHTSISLIRNAWFQIGFGFWIFPDFWIAILFTFGWGSVDWIQLAQDRDRWRALVNTVMNLRVLAPRS
jgi:hypothetical protein